MDWGLWYCTGGGDEDHDQDKEMQKEKGCLRSTYKELRREKKLKANEKRKHKSIWMQSSRE